MPTPILIISTQSPLTPKEKEKRIKMPGETQPGETGLAMQQVCGGGFIVMTQKNIHTFQEPAVRQHVQDNGWLIITGHGQKSGTDLKGEYLDSEQIKRMGVKRPPEAYVEAAMKAGLERGHSINILLSVCYAAEGNPCFAQQLAAAFSAKGINTNIVASVAPVRRFNETAIRKEEETSSVTFGAKPEDLRIFKNREQQPSRNEEFLITSDGIGFKSDLQAKKLGIIPLENIEQLSRAKAEEKLRDQQNLSYIIRNSSEQGKFAISLKLDNTAHLDIRHVLIDIENTGYSTKIDGFKIGPVKDIKQLIKSAMEVAKIEMVYSALQAQYPDSSLKHLNFSDFMKSREEAINLLQTSNRTILFHYDPNTSHQVIVSSKDSSNNIHQVPYSVNDPKLKELIEEFAINIVKGKIEACFNEKILGQFPNNDIRNGLVDFLYRRLLSGKEFKFKPEDIPFFQQLTPNQLDLLINGLEMLKKDAHIFNACAFDISSLRNERFGEGNFLNNIELYKNALCTRRDNLSPKVEKDFEEYKKRIETAIGATKSRKQPDPKQAPSSKERARIKKYQAINDVALALQEIERNLGNYNSQKEIHAEMEPKLEKLKEAANAYQKGHILGSSTEKRVHAIITEERQKFRGP